MPEVTTARKQSERDRTPGVVFLPPAAGRRLFIQRRAGSPLVPVAIGALTTALLTVTGGLSTPVLIAVSLATALVAFGIRILWLRNRS